MNQEDQEDILNVVQRWEPLGLLDGLPILEKTELAVIYDNATRLMLSEISIKKIPKSVSDIFDNVLLPICRRLYKRVGPNFELDLMLSSLLDVINERKGEILKVDPKEPEKNPIVSFCIEFADSYEDDTTNKNILTDEEYGNKIEKILSSLKNVLLNDNIISWVDSSDGEYKINLSKAKKTKQQTRFYNQSVAKNLLNSALSEINKGI